MNIPSTGSNPAKTKFFREVATAFEFLAVFYTLSEEDQQAIMEHITQLQAKALS